MTHTTQKLILSLDTKWNRSQTYPAYHHRDSSNDEAAAYADNPLADVKWTARHQGEMKAKEDLQHILNDQL